MNEQVDENGMRISENAFRKHVQAYSMRTFPRIFLS
jgi:hypothetical protein